MPTVTHCASGGKSGGIRSDLLLHQVPAPVPDVVLSLKDTPPPQSRQQGLRTKVIGPELRDMPPGTRRPLLERRQKPVGVALVPLLRQDHHIDQVRHPTPEPVAQATDPVTNLVAED